MWLWGKLVEWGQHTRSHIKETYCLCPKRHQLSTGVSWWSIVSSATQDDLLTGLILYRYYIQLLWSHQCSHPVMPRRYCFSLVLLTFGSYHLSSSSSIMVPSIYFANKISNKLFLVISKSLSDNSNVGTMFQFHFGVHLAYS